jgi:hypothetical protein
MYNGCRTFSGHPPCWSRSLSPHMGGRSHPCATKASPESPLRDAGTVPCGAETPRGRSHPCTPLVAVTADQAPCAKPLSPTVPIQSDVGTGAYSALEEGCFWLVPSSCCRIVCYAYHAGAMCYCLGSVEPGAPGATQTRLSLIVFPPPAPRVCVGSDNRCINLFNVIWGCGECLIYFNP